MTAALLDRDPTDEEVTEAKAYAQALTDAIKLARYFREVDVRTEDGRRPEVNSSTVYAVAELHEASWVVGEPVTVTPKRTANHAPRSAPARRPANTQIKDDGIECPTCKTVLPVNKFPTVKDGSRDFRECRTCIKARRAGGAQ